MTGNIVVLQIGILYDIMQKRGDNTVLIQTHVRSNIRCCDTMGYIGAAVFTLLTRMGGFGHLIGSMDTPDVYRMRLLTEFLLKRSVHLIRIKQGVSTEIVRLISHVFFLFKNADQRSRRILIISVALRSAFFS